MLGVINLEVYNSVFLTTKQNKRFACNTPGQWEDDETPKKQDELFEQKSWKKIKWQVNAVKKVEE